MPSSNGSYDANWFSFDYGAIHFTIMSSEHDFLRGSPQYEFIAADLAAVDRGRTPWLIFGGHRPMYSAVAGVPRAAGRVTVVSHERRLQSGPENVQERHG